MLAPSKTPVREGGNQRFRQILNHEQNGSCSKTGIFMVLTLVEGMTNKKGKRYLFSTFRNEKATGAIAFEPCTDS